MQDLARDVKKEAQIFEKHLPLHHVSDMYHWQYSSTFVFVSNRRHYYNVHYADSSALKIKTGQDVVQIGPYRVMSRFGLIEEAVSGTSPLHPGIIVPPHREGSQRATRAVRACPLLRRAGLEGAACISGIFGTPDGHVGGLPCSRQETYPFLVKRHTLS